MIKELVENYFKACNALEDATGVILSPESLQCSTKGFLKLAKQCNAEIQISIKEDTEYPYRPAIEIEGYTFFTRWSQEEYETYMKGRVA